MLLKKTSRKDKQRYDLPKQSEQISHHSSQQCRNFFKQIKSNIINATKQSSIQQLTVIELSQRNQHVDLETQRLVDSFIEIFIWEITSQSSSQPLLNQQDEQIMKYLVKQMVLVNSSPSESSLWKHKELLLMGKTIQKEMEHFKGVSRFNHTKLLQLIIFNNAVCYTQLHMFMEALSSLSLIQKLQKYTHGALRIRVDSLKNVIWIAMGKPCKPMSWDCSSKIARAQADTVQVEDLKLRITKEFLMLQQKSKQELNSFIEAQRVNCTLFLPNAYNLAVLCKRHGLNFHSKNILLSLLQEDKVRSNNQFQKKCLILLSILSEEEGHARSALRHLQAIETSDEDEKEEISYRMWKLKKKIKLEKAISSCPDYTVRASKKYQLLQSLHDELDRITNKTHRIFPERERKLTSALYQPKKKKCTIKTLSQLSLKKQQSSLIPPMLTMLSRQSSSKMSTKPIVEKKQSEVFQSNIRQQLQAIVFSDKKPQIEAVRQERPKKTVRFRAEAVQQPQQLALDIIYQSQEKIMGAVIQQRKDEVLSLIRQAFEKIEAIEKSVPAWSLSNFKIKCINWCKQVKAKEQAANLLQNEIKKISQKGEVKIRFMKELSKAYEQMFQYRKAVKINMELVELGEADYLDKNGELCLAKQDYSQAAQYYEQYYRLSSTTYALVKLAHAYSKICTHTKIAIEILSDLLFQSRKSCDFKHFDPSESQHIQNAVILLATIHISMNGIKRAQQICEHYLKINFSAYAVYYLLGIIQNLYGNQKEAFNQFINSLKLKPNHLPSLLEIVKFIGLGHSNTAQIISVLRRAFVYNHRNWELLHLLIEAVTNSPREKNPISIKRLIECARILDEMGGATEDLLLEAQLVWLWALEYIEQKKHYLPCFDHEYSTICIRLGQINLKKGNYEASEFFFKKILLKLHDDRFQPSMRKHENIRLQLQLMDRLVYIKLQQQKKGEAFDLLNQSQGLAKENSLEIWAAEISHKISQLRKLFQIE